MLACVWKSGLSLEETGSSSRSPASNRVYQVHPPSGPYTFPFRASCCARNKGPSNADQLRYREGGVEDITVVNFKVLPPVFFLFPFLFSFFFFFRGGNRDDDEGH